MSQDATSDDDSAALVLLSVREDEGPFESLGTMFSCNKSPWIGKTAGSPVAIYLLKTRKNSQGYGGGLAGAMISAALAKDDGLSTCSVADLPDPIRTHLDPKGKLGSKDVVIVPKATVSLVKGGGWNNVIAVAAGYDNFKLSTPVFSMFAKPKALTRMGWTLNTPITPTSAPVHDMRAPTERVPLDKPLWKKVLLILGAVGIILAVIALRIAGH